MRYTSIEVVKVSEERVDISVKPAPKAVEVVDPKDFWEMVEILRNLEDRFVGFRDEVMLNLGDAMLDIKHMQGDVDTLKNEKIRIGESQ
jgi:hypothetical protein